uniref:hypothetical protein n=1 Tax=Peptoniphilus grossensis TaxID=1465756 RepID=UPI00288B9DA0|nr:hypothetical protein [Peptoniphilus grossensis]
MGFDKCCQCRNVKLYDTQHNPKPMDWPEEVNESISSLLWYIPNIDSVQSYKDELIENKVYDNLTFDYICSSLGMSEEKDFLFLENKAVIPEDLWNFYRGEICTHCQKAILTQYSNHTKTKTLLRCIRNAVAHGDFTIVDDMLIGFNVNNHGEKKAIIKIKYKRLRDSLKTIRKAYSKEIIIANALNKIGYNTIINGSYIRIGNKIIMPDIIAKKDNITYVFEIKVIKNSRYLNKKILDSYIRQVMSYKTYFHDEKIKFVFVFDTSRLTKTLKEYLEDFNEIIVMDINEIIKLSYGEDILIDELY